MTMSLPRNSVLIGLIGANIMKSLSPALHEDQLTAHGLRGHYHLMDLDRLPGRRVDTLLAAIKTAGFHGTNVTFPVKQAVIPLLDGLSPDARRVGAVNTVTIGSDGQTTGYNTDCIGFRRNVEDGLGRAAVEGRPVVLVGAGGAGRAVAFALMDLGAACILAHDTDTAKSTALVADLIRHFGTESARVVERLDAAIEQAAGVVNATPIGMLGIPGNPVPMAAVSARHWVADIIYTPMETELIRSARARGARILTGGGMCVHQAAEAFHLFTGLQPDIARMHRTFASALAARDRALVT